MSNVSTLTAELHQLSQELIKAERRASEAASRLANYLDSHEDDEFDGPELDKLEKERDLAESIVDDIINNIEDVENELDEMVNTYDSHDEDM